MTDSENYKIRNASYGKAYQRFQESVFLFRIKELKTGIK